MITQELRYAMVLLEELRQKNIITVRQVADTYNLSVKFLEQVAGKLRQAAIISGSRGRTGGYHLVRREISMNDILSAFGHLPPSISCRLADACKGGAMCAEREIEAKMIGEMNDSMARMVISS